MVKGGAWTRAVPNLLMKPWIMYFSTWILTHENPDVCKSTNLSSTVSHLALLFQVIYSWNNHQQNNEATNLLHFPFFAFCVCQGLSHLELKGKTLLRMGELWAQRCFLSSSVLVLWQTVNRGANGRQAQTTQKERRRLIMMMVIRIEVDYMTNWY